MDVISLMSNMASFGAAGLMGTMWLWERKLSRLREQQLTESHERILRDEQRLDKLTCVIEQNSSAITRFSEVQRETSDVLKHLMEEFHHARIR